MPYGIVQPEIGVSLYPEAPVTTVEVTIRNQVNNPQPSEIGKANYTNPIAGGILGTNEQYQTPTQIWSWVSGNNGSQMHGTQPTGYPGQQVASTVIGQATYANTPVGQAYGTRR